MITYKVLQVIDSLEVGGAEKVVINLSNILNENNIDVSVLTLRDKNPLKDTLNKNICFYCLERKNKYSISKMLEFKKIVNQFDIIHIHMRHTLKYIWLIDMLFHLKPKIIFQDHYGKIKTNKNISYFIKKAILKYDYIGVSNELCQWSYDYLKKEKEHVYLLPNIIKKTYIKNKIETKSKYINIILVSNFKREKNIDFSIDLFLRLKKQKENIKFHIYGNISDKIYYDEILTKIQEYDLINDIKIISDCLDIQSILANYTIALHTSISETGPLVLLEYLAHQLKFLTYNTGEVVEKLAHNNVKEIIMKDFNLDRWEKAFFNILEDSQLSFKLNNFYKKNYSEEEYYTKCQKIYENLIY